MMHEEPELLVADSFRVRAHPVSGELEARSLRAHFARFRASALEAWQSAEMQEPAPPEELRSAARGAMEIASIRPHGDSWPDGAGPVLLVDYQTPAQRKVSELIDTFLADARQQIAAFGAGWPRLELWGAPDTEQSVTTNQQLRLSLRRLPKLGEAIDLRAAEYTPVAHPERKGPNIAHYAQLNRRLGAEALLTDERGRVVEGATTSLLWWRDGKLCVSQDSGRVASVTEHFLRDYAIDNGVVILSGNELPTMLKRYEVWAVNALHGIRTVASIDGVRLLSPDEDRLSSYRDALDTSWQPMRSHQRSNG